MPSDPVSQERARAKRSKRSIASLSARGPAASAQREYAGLRLFLTQAAGFRLGIARFDRPATRDGLIRRLIEDLKKTKVHLGTLDVRAGEGSLLRRLQLHLEGERTPEGWQRAVTIVNLEDRLIYSDLSAHTTQRRGKDLSFLEEANLHRDAFSATCPWPLLLWLTEPAETALGKYAPDLWHWRSARFDFEHEGSDLTDVRVHPRERLAWFREIAAASRRLGDRRGEIWDLIQLGNANFELGCAREALTHYESALVVARAIGDRRGEEAALGSLGNGFSDLGEFRKAMDLFEQALMIAREIGHKRHEGITLGNLGNCWDALGEPRKAIELAEQALVIARELGNKKGEAMCLGNLGNYWAELGEPRKALELYEQTLAIFREIGDRRFEAVSLANLANCWSALGEPRKAIEFYEQALVITREIDDRRGEGTVLYNLAVEFAKSNELARAAVLLEESVRIHEEVEDPWLPNVRAQLEKVHAKARQAEPVGRLT